MFKQGGKFCLSEATLTVMMLLALFPTRECAVPEISYPPSPQNDFKGLTPILNSSIEGYNRIFSEFVIPWQARFQSKEYSKLWLCSDGTLYFTRPFETFSPWESHDHDSPAYIRLDCRGLTAMLIQVFVNSSSFTVEYVGKDMTFPNQYQIHWLLTYYRTEPHQPEVFDISILSNTLKENAGIVQNGWYERKLNINKVTLTRYTALTLRLAPSLMKKIVVIVCMTVLGIVVVIILFCCLAKCKVCEPTRRCFIDCCCQCCGKCLTVSPRIPDRCSKLPKQKKVSLEQIENPELASERRLQQNSIKCELCRLYGADTETVCQHRYHRRCLRIWYESLSMCPRCKEPKGAHTTKCGKCNRFAIAITADQLIPSEQELCMECGADEIHRPTA